MKKMHFELEIVKYIFLSLFRLKTLVWAPTIFRFFTHSGRYFANSDHQYTCFHERKIHIGKKIKKCTLMLSKSVIAFNIVKYHASVFPKIKLFLKLLYFVSLSALYNCKCFVTSFLLGQIWKYRKMGIYP